MYYIVRYCIMHDVLHFQVDGPGVTQRLRFTDFQAPAYSRYDVVNLHSTGWQLVSLDFYAINLQGMYE